MPDRLLALRLWLDVALKPAPALFGVQLLLAAAAQSLAPLASFYGAKARHRRFQRR